MHIRCKCHVFSIVLGQWSAQLPERLLPTPEICGSNSVIGEFLKNNYILSNVLKNKEREPGNGPFKKIAENFDYLMFRTQEMYSDWTLKVV